MWIDGLTVRAEPTTRGDTNYCKTHERAHGKIRTQATPMPAAPRPKAPVNQTPVEQVMPYSSRTLHKHEHPRTKSGQLKARTIAPTSRLASPPAVGLKATTGGGGGGGCRAPDMPAASGAPPALLSASLSKCIGKAESRRESNGYNITTSISQSAQVKHAT